MVNKVLDDTNLQHMSGYEYLVLTVLHKHIEPGLPILFTVNDLKRKMLCRRNDKWQLCMSGKTLNRTLKALVDNNCIELIRSISSDSEKTYILLKRNIAHFDNKLFMKICYNAAKELIFHQITQDEFKIFFWIVLLEKEGMHFSVEYLDKILHMGSKKISRGIQNLKRSLCIDVVQAGEVYYGGVRL